jgi:uncharacterized RDD family membrane protein YckC
MPVTTSSVPLSASNRYAPPRAAVRDVSYASDDPADRGTRFAAALLDSIILAAMVYLPLFVGMFVGAATAADSGSAGVVVIGGMVLALVGFAAWCWLTIKYVVANGQSIAKKMLGIKVVRSDGSDISLGRIFWLRNFVNALISIIPLYGLIDVLFIFSESRQCLHDKLADTMVVKA